MPPSAGTRGLTPDQKILYQKERNRLKQQTLRARRKATKAGDQDGTMEGGMAAGDDSITLLRASTSTSSSSSSSGVSGKQREKKTLSGLEPGEGGFMMKARRAVELREEEQKRRERGEESSSRNSERGMEGSTSASISVVAEPRPRPSSPAVISVPSSKSKLTSVSLFATLLNGGSLPRPNASTTSAHDHSLPLRRPVFSSSQSSSSHFQHQLVLNQQQPPSFWSSQQPTLPSYTFLSPANIGSFPFFNPLNSIDWKFRLFQAHSVLYADRNHPTKGYLHNSFANSTISTAQTLILQLLASTSPPGRKEQLDARRRLSFEDEEFLRLEVGEGRMDRRIEWMPDPLVRVNAMKASRCGLVNLTEKAAAGIETATIFGDAMDSGAWMLSNHVSLDTRTLYLVPSIDETGCERNPSVSSAGNQLHGASVREIVLGLELPGWRIDTPLVQPAPMTDEELEESWRLDWIMGKKMKTLLGTTFPA